MTAVAAAERRAKEIVRQAEQEAFGILEEAATAAFDGSRRRPRARAGTKALAVGSFALAVAAVVAIALGRL